MQIDGSWVPALVACTSRRKKVYNMSTREDLRRWYIYHDHCKLGYVCYQDDNLSRSELVELGYNSGVYGWNWTAYLHPETDTLYVSCYRNVPAYIREK